MWSIVFNRIHLIRVMSYPFLNIESIINSIVISLKVLASSGIDYDIKLWAPLNDKPFFDSIKADEVFLCLSFKAIIVRK